MSTCNQKQNDAISSILKFMKGKAYVIIFELCDEEEQTAFYQVRYNDKSGCALDFKQWTAGREEVPNEQESIYVSVKAFAHNMIDELMGNMCENTVIVRNIMMLADGSID